MNILVLGSGGVGTSIAVIAAERDFYDQIILGDIDESRAKASIKDLDEKHFARLSSISPNII